MKFLQKTSPFALAAMLVLSAGCGSSTPEVEPTSGSIADPFGNAARDVPVSATNEHTHQRYDTVTDSRGHFVLPLSPGDYTWTVDKNAINTQVHVPIAQSAPVQKLVFPLLTGGSFLVGRAQESSGFGLYSYLLLGGKPGSARNDETRQRYAGVVQAFLESIQPVIILQKQAIPNLQLNISYILITQEPPALSGGHTTWLASGRTIDADWVLDHYNYARAADLLRLLPGGLHENGPYIVSTSGPLSAQSQPPDHYLYQDLTQVPDERIAYLWVKEFQQQASNERFWREDIFGQKVLELRTLIANAAQALQPTDSAAKTVAGIVHSAISSH